MDAIKDEWEIIVFTASCQNYADTILDYLDPKNEYFQHRCYREKWWRTPDNVYVKDLRVFHQWDLENIILVDNAVYSFGFQLNNGIPIFNYIQGKDDKQLLYLKEYLNVISSKSIIKDLKKTFKMTDLYNTDIDKFLDFYDDDQEVDELPMEETLDYLSQSFSRMKAKSFQVPRIQNRFNSDAVIHKVPSDNDKISEELSNFEMQRSQTENLAGGYENANFNPFLDAMLLGDSSVQDQNTDVPEKIEPTPKTKPRRIRYSAMKKAQSTWEKFTKSGVNLSESTLLRLGIKTDSKNEDESSGNTSNNSRETPKRGRRLKKRKKINKMKELKLGFGMSWDDSEYIDEQNEMKKLSLFSKEENKKNESDSESWDDDTNEIGRFYTKPGDGLSKSHKLSSKYVFHRNARTDVKKRNSSPPSIVNSTERDENEINNSGHQRKYSKTSSSRSSDNLERDDDSGAMTTSASKNPTSMHSSLDNNNSKSNSEKLHFVSKFNNDSKEAIIEEFDDESPLRERVNSRKDSLTYDLDLLMKCSMNLNMHRTNSDIYHFPQSREQPNDDKK